MIRGDTWYRQPVRPPLSCSVLSSVTARKDLSPMADKPSSVAGRPPPMAGNPLMLADKPSSVAGQPSVKNSVLCF